MSVSLTSLVRRGGGGGVGTRARSKPCYFVRDFNKSEDGIRPTMVNMSMVGNYLLMNRRSSDRRRRRTWRWRRWRDSSCFSFDILDANGIDTRWTWSTLSFSFPFNDPFTKSNRARGTFTLNHSFAISYRGRWSFSSEFSGFCYSGAELWWGRGKRTGSLSFYHPGSKGCFHRWRARTSANNSLPSLFADSHWRWGSGPALKRSTQLHGSFHRSFWHSLSADLCIPFSHDHLTWLCSAIVISQEIGPGASSRLRASPGINIGLLEVSFAHLCANRWCWSFVPIVVSLLIDGIPTTRHGWR